MRPVGDGRGGNGLSQTSNTSAIITPRINYSHRTIVKSGIEKSADLADWFDPCIIRHWHLLLTSHTGDCTYNCWSWKSVCLFFFIEKNPQNKQKHGFTISKRHIPKNNDTIVKEWGMSTGRADRWLQSHCTYWSADGQMKLIFWGRQCRHISSSRCKAILSRGSGANLVHLDRLWSPASANCTLSDGSTHPSCFPTCLTTMVLTLSLIWYTHSVMDSRQHALWQDREISLRCSQCRRFCAAGDAPSIQGRFI